jgi:hypothetical protein
VFRWITSSWERGGGFAPGSALQDHFVPEAEVDRVQRLVRILRGSMSSRVTMGFSLRLPGLRRRGCVSFVESVVESQIVSPSRVRSSATAGG